MPTSPEELSQFYTRTGSARKIIVVDLGFLGDSVHLVPACWELKQHYPHAELHTLSAMVGSEVLRLAPCVDRAWGYPLSNPSPPWWKHLALLRSLRRERFDVAFNFSGADRTVYLTALIGARHRIAQTGGRKHFYNPWLIPHWVPRPPMDLPVFEKRRQLLAATGMKLEAPRFDLRPPEEAKDWAAATLPAGSIHLSINASSPFKEWPLENWLTFAPQLAAQTGRQLVATCDGSPRERQRVEDLARSVGKGRVLALPDRLPLARLAALLSRCALHVGADSGVTHLAMALAVPTVTAYREYEGRLEWTPPGPLHRQLIISCRCLRELQADCAATRQAACLTLIPPSKVLHECLDSLAGSSTTR